MRMISKTIFTTALLLATTTIASAQDPAPAPPPEPTPAGDQPEDAGTGTPGKVSAPTPTSDLPASQSDNDVQPEVASPSMPAGGLVSQAGVGGVVGYGRAGVLELGGSAGFTFASDYRNLNLSPSIGWFVADNLEVSAILSISNIKAGDSSSTLWSALIEPSYHLPINRSTFIFGGLGLGASHVSSLGTGFAIAPRAGMNFMIGRSGVLTPSISYQYTTIEADSGMTDVTIVALTSAVQVNMGYTAMW